MTFVTRTCAAVTLLGALVVPSAAGVALVAHLAGEGHSHAHPAVHDTGAVVLVVHGHHHEPGTPLHQHTPAIAKPATTTTRLSLILE
jgi:hypothetical protein